MLEKCSCGVFDFVCSLFFSAAGACRMPLTACCVDASDDGSVRIGSRHARMGTPAASSGGDCGERAHCDCIISDCGRRANVIDRRVVHVGLALVLAGMAMFLLPSPTAEARGAARAEFSSKATNGYTVYVEGSGRQVALTVDGHGGSARYSVRGRASTRQLKGRFGKFGRIALRFASSGKSRQIKPPKRCEGRNQVSTPGKFIGTIRFRGRVVTPVWSGKACAEER